MRSGKSQQGRARHAASGAEDDWIANGFSLSLQLTSTLHVCAAFVSRRMMENSIILSFSRRAAMRRSLFASQKLGELLRNCRTSGVELTALAAIVPDSASCHKFEGVLWSVLIFGLSSLAEIILTEDLVPDIWASSASEGLKILSFTQEHLRPLHHSQRHAKFCANAVPPR